MKDECVSIKISVKNDIELIDEFFKKLDWIEPKEIKMRTITNGKYKKNIKLYSSQIKKELLQNQTTIVFEAGEESIDGIRNDENSNNFLLSATLMLSTFQEKEKEIYAFIESIMKSIGIVASISSLEDIFWQNNTSINMYDYLGKSLNNIPLRESMIFTGRKEVDVDKLPGHYKLIDGLWYGATWQMWFSSLYFEYVDQKAINEFKNCYVNECVSNNCIHIQLYEDIKDYDKKENRERQWEFKRSIAFNEVVEAAEERYSKQESDPTTEILTGTFEHGGTRKIVTYLSKNEKIVSKKVATKFEELEYDSTGKLLYRGIIEV